ncbi:hypothetical protein LOK49_LG07G00986, partial [Camellia lanceoleosa]
LWVYVYLPTLAPELVVAGPLMTPYSLVFEGQHRPRPRETLFYLRQYFDTVRTTEITWQPWAPLGDGLRFQYAGGSGTSQYRILLEGPVGRAWFLGERFLRQVWGYTSQDPPAAPPVSMRTADRLSSQDVVSAMLGTDALLHLEEGDYATYRHVYLMPPLTGVRTPSLRPAGVPSSSQARATDIPSSSRAGTSRGGGGSVPPIPPTLHHPGWPDMPTELTSWRFGVPYQVSLEPPLPDHRYVRDPDSPPVCFTALIYQRRAHVIEAEPDEEEEEEVADHQSETSAEEGDSGLGSGSGSEAEGDPEDDSSDPDDDGNAELWVYVYFPTLAPEMEVAGPLMTPFSLVFEGQHRPRPRETLFYLRQYFDTVWTTEITWQPWAVLGDGLRFQYPGGASNSQYRFLLEGPVGRAWFLGERFIRQVWGYNSQEPPAAPPVTMRTADRLSTHEVVSAMQGIDALLHLTDGDYATYRHTYLMPPLTGVRAPPLRPANVPSSSRARATDIPSSSKAGTSRGGGGSIPPIPPTLHHSGWPDMPTKLTIEYMDEMLGMLATFEGMILRREAQMAITGVQ